MGGRHTRILVIGSQGQLGSELCRQLGDRAVGLDFPDLDITDRRSVAAAMAASRPGAVINTAAYTRVDQAETEPEACFAVNATGVAHLAEACCAADAALVQVSSDYVFGGDRPVRAPYRESDEPHPEGVYASSKREGELCAAACPKHIIIRTCGLYGHRAPRAAGTFVDTMLRLAETRNVLRVVDDQHCTPTSVVHVARAIAFLLESGAGGVYHVVCRGQTTWLGFAREIFRQADLDVRVDPISTAEYGLAAPRPAYSVLDTGRYHALAGCPVMPPWEEALAEYLDSIGRRAGSGGGNPGW